MDIAAIIISVISLIFSIVLGVINYKIIKAEHKMKKEEHLQNKEKELRIEFDKRPKLEIISIGEMTKYAEGDVVDVDCLVAPIGQFLNKHNYPKFIYSEKLLDKDRWVSKTFVLKNVGKTTIDYFYVAWNAPKSTSLFNVRGGEYSKFIEDGILNYGVIYDGEVKRGDSLSIRINFHEDLVASKLTSAEASIWMFDSYKKIWRHPFFVHNDQIYDCNKVDISDFRNNVLVEDALECFKNPDLW